MEPSEKPKVSVIMPTFNGRGVIENSIPSIFEKTCYPDFELIIIDNASTDDTCDWIEDFKKKEELANLQIIRLDKKQNQGKIFEQILDAAKSNDVIKVRDDIVVQSEKWISQFVDTAYSFDNIGIVHSCSVLGNETLDFFEIKAVSRDLVCNPPPGLITYHSSIHNHTLEIEAGCLNCVFIKNELLGKLTYDSKFDSSWLGDIDYCLRARKAGYRIVCTQKNIICPSTTERDKDQFFVERPSKKHLKYFRKKWWVPGNPKAILDRYSDNFELIKFITPNTEMRAEAAFGKREIVIARFDEDLSWFKAPPADQVTVYNKGYIRPDHYDIILPNEGREAGTYLYHIISNWENLAEQTVFLQGNAPIKSPDIIQLLQNYYDSVQPLTWRTRESPLEYVSRQFVQDGVPPRFFRQGNDSEYVNGARVTVDWLDRNGRCVYPGYFYEPSWELAIIAPLRKDCSIPPLTYFLDWAWECLDEQSSLPLLLPHVYSAMMSVPRKAIKARPKEFYQRCYNLLDEEPRWAWILEKLWLVIFGYHENRATPEAAASYVGYHQDLESLS
jgi:glycosyltransferase involved in cell wall biosynthesis